MSAEYRSKFEAPYDIEHFIGKWRFFGKLCNTTPVTQDVRSKAISEDP